MYTLFNLTTCQIRKKHVNIYRPECMYRHVAKGGGCDLGWPVYVNCPISNNHIMKNKKMASQDFRDSLQKLHVYDNFIIISIKIQSFF